MICALALSLLFGWNDSAPNAHPSIAFLLRGWVWPTGYDFLLMCTCGGIAALGLTLLTLAYTVGQSSVVAPFEFTFAFWGLLWGWLFWRELPNTMGWLCIALIIGAGIYVLRAKEKAAP